MHINASKKKLQRRIHIMFTHPYGKNKWIRTLLCAVLCFGFMMATALASRGLAPDRHISLAQAKRLAQKAAKDASFPIAMNDHILEQLNRYLGTPESRTYMRDSLARMEMHRKAIEKKLAEYGAPRALLAVPLVESGYRNLPPIDNSIAAGVWQFIETTARHYGMRVDGQVDERLNVETETDAAIRYLMANHFRFKDWGLALLAYNAGAGAVQNGIDATGSRNAWKLIQEGYENDKGYLGKVVAALIIMCNPSLL
jgi:membrane-bound lytic murein transglycosylase D